MIFAVIGLCVGILIGIYSPFEFPSGYSTYFAIGILACIDSVMGGIKAEMKESFNTSIFISGFFGNAAISISLIWIGTKLNIDLSIAAIVVYGSRLFENFAAIRRFLLNKNEKQDNI